MVLVPNRARRPASLRLRGHNYGSNGAYFLTICTHERLCLLAEVDDGIVRLTPAGQVARDCWEAIPDHFPDTHVDVFVIMPNHVHGIVHVGARHAVPLPSHSVPPPQSTERFGQPVPGSIPTIVRSFKSAATTRINALHGTPGRVVWQRNYHDRVVRDEDELNRIRTYIAANPTRWADDEDSLW